MTDAYRADLAHVHDSGYGGLAENAAPVLLAELRRRGVEGGLVVDLGCGGGVLSEKVAAAGYDVLGIDISEAMVALARRRVPSGRFVVGSFLTEELPPCVAVAAVGEIFNYLFDKGNTERQLEKVFRRVHRALALDGVLLFDVAGPGRGGAGGRQAFREGDDWAVLVTVAEDRERRLLTREITTFRKVGDLYRRDYELHRQRLYEPAAMAARLRAVGFRVRRLAAYGPLRLARGHAAFLARKGT